MLKKISRFSLVGGLGTLTNLIVFIIVERNLALDSNLAATLAFLVAVTQNFWFNRLWTFSTHYSTLVKPLSGWIKYLGVNLFGFGINLITLNALILWAGDSQVILYQAIGILAGMSFNFLLSNNLIFRSQLSRPPQMPRQSTTRIARDPLWIFKSIIFWGFGIASLWHISLELLGYSWPQNTFLFNPNDRFNDWQNTVNASAHFNPYFEPNRVAISAYFPFTYLITQLFSYLQRNVSIAGYLIASMLLMALSIRFTLESLSKTNKAFHLTSESFKQWSLVFSFFLTYPVLFSLDRGNLDIWIASLCLIYVTSLYSEYKVIGIISLSVAIAFKGYPIAFLILAISKRKYHEVFVCLMLTTILSLLSLVFMEGGFTYNLAGFTNNLSQFRESYVIGSSSLFASSDPYNAIRLLYLAFEDHDAKHLIHISTTLHKYYIVLSFMFALTCTYFALAIPSRPWKKIMSICLLTILFPDVANDYKLNLLIPGTLFLLFDQQANTKVGRASIVLVGLLMIPKSYIFIHDRSISMLINPCLLLLLAAITLIEFQTWRVGHRTLKFRVIWHISSWFFGGAILASITTKKPVTFIQKRHWSLEELA